MKNKNAVHKLSSIRDVVIQDLMAATDDELREEARQRGEDFSAIASKARGIVQNAVAEVQRQRLAKARQEMNSTRIQPLKAAAPPPIEMIKDLIKALFQKDPSIQLAFRNGKVQTDEELMSLYNDLVVLGKIDPTSHAD